MNAVAAAVRPIGWRPTGNAARLTVALIAMGLAAVNYQSNTAWMLTLLLTAAAVVALFHARRNLTGISGSIAPIPPVFAGDAIPVTVVLGNAAAVPAIAVWVMSNEAGNSPAQPRLVPAGGSAAAIITLAPRQRGTYTVPTLRAASTFPLGVVEAHRVFNHPGDGIVYPRPDGRRLDEVLGDGDPGDSIGDQTGDDFAGHRRPQPGDPPRHVDWKAVARGRPVLLKTFAGGICECLLTWDMAQGDGEQRLSELTRWVLDAEARGWRFAMRLPGIDIESDGGIEHRERCLRTLALLVVP